VSSRRVFAIAAAHCSNPLLLLVIAAISAVAMIRASTELGRQVTASWSPPSHRLSGSGRARPRPGGIVWSHHHAAL